jgi:transposase
MSTGLNPDMRGWTRMKTTRKRYSADFKAKVALEAIRGDLTLSELGAKHGIHHTTIAAWKPQAVEGMSATFSGAGARAKVATEADLEKLRAKIEQLILERDVLAKASPQNCPRRQHHLRRPIMEGAQRVSLRRLATGTEILERPTLPAPAGSG